MDINGYITIFSNLTILIGVFIAYHFQKRQIDTLNTEVQSKNRIITDLERLTKLTSMRTVENIVRLREEEIRLKSKEEMRKIIEEKEEEEKIQFEKLRKELDNLVSKSDEQTETLNMVVDNYENLQEAWTQLFTLAGILLRYVPPQVRNELTDEYITDKRTKRVLQQSIDLTKNQWMYSDLIPAGIGYPGEYLDTKPVIPTKGISFSSANDKK